MESSEGGPLRVCVCPSWRMSSVQMDRGLFSCARARWVKSCRGSHTHTVTTSLFSHTHNKATMPGAGTGAKGSWFSHSESILDLSRGLGVSPCHSAESGWPLNSAVPIISSLTNICIPQPWGSTEVFYSAKLCCLCCISKVTAWVGQENADFIIMQHCLYPKTSFNFLFFFEPCNTIIVFHISFQPKQFKMISWLKLILCCRYYSLPVQLLKSSDIGRHSLLYLKEIGHGWFGKVKPELFFYTNLYIHLSIESRDFIIPHKCLKLNVFFVLFPPLLCVDIMRISFIESNL